MGCIDASRYAEHLERFAEHVPREQLLLVDFSRLRQAPEAVFHEVCDFAGVPRCTPESVGAVFNPRRRVWSQRTWRWLDHRPGRRSWREQPKGLDRLLAPRARRPALPSATRQLLEEYFAPYDDRLRAFWGRTELPWDG